MKRALLSPLLTLTTLLGISAAQAATVTSGALQVVDAVSATLSAPFNPAPVNLAGYAGVYAGKLNATTAGTLSATYLGQESGYLNGFSFVIGAFPLSPDASGILNESSLIGKTIQTSVNAGLIDFWFRDSTGGWVSNTAGSDGNSRFAVFNYADKCITGYGCFDFILGFDDSGGGLDRDFDDFMVGVKLSPVPLPAAAWLFGSALLGFVTVSNRRRI